MLKVVAFMKQVAVGLQMEANFGTAHICLWWEKGFCFS
mgnify:CR=1 FL=1